MLKKAALAVGAVFVLIGVLGFVPGITSTDDMGMKMLLGLFMVGALHNVVHLVSGAAALYAGSASERMSKLFFQVMTVVYGLVTVLGFIAGSGHKILGLLPINTADNILHLVLTLAFAYLGFAVAASRTERAEV